MHESIFDYVFEAFGIALGVDEIFHIIANGIDVDTYVEVNYGS
jgi:hypothetical protein